MKILSAEFSGVRSQLYKECLHEFPEARKQDFEIMQKYLDPQKNQTILEVGAGSGFFSGKIADQCKKLYVSDPSLEQLQAVETLGKNNVVVLEGGAEVVDLQENSIDSIRSFGAFHHCFNKSKSFETFKKVLKPGGKIVIVDVLSGSDLAKHFDDKVAKYCITGHEVSFLTKEYFQSLCYVFGFGNLEIVDVDIKRIFKKEKDIGNFLYKLHAMTKTSIDECLKGAQEILGVTKRELEYYLNRPLTVFMAQKIEKRI